MEQLVSKYLSRLDLPVSRSYCEKCIVSHPDYPSLLSISDTLERLGVNHRLGQIGKDKLSNISFPYLIHLNGGGGKFKMINSQNELDDLNDDWEDWDGVILNVDPASTIADKENNHYFEQEKLQRNLLALLGAALLGLLLTAVIQYGSWLHLLLFGTVLAGVAVGYLLMAKELGIRYKPVETFCNAGRRTNCDRILHARDARLLSFFTFTDAAASYFAFQLIIAGLFIPLFTGGRSFLAALAAAGLLAVPVVGYSLYYQYVKAHTWCRLCLVVDAVLAAQIAILGFMYVRQMFLWSDAQPGPVTMFALLFFVVSSSVVLLKNRLKKANRTLRSETAAKRVMHDPEVFSHLLRQQASIEVTPFTSEMRLGQAGAPLQIIMAANLHCNPCRKAFQKVNQLLAAYPQKVSVSFRLTPGMDKPMEGLSSSTYLIRYWQQYILNKEGTQHQTQAYLQAWYREMNPIAFAQTYPPDGDELKTPNGSPPLEEQHYRWVEENEITATPTFYINGYEMPRNYRLQDLMALTPGLAALYKRDNNMKTNLNKDFA